MIYKPGGCPRWGTCSECGEKYTDRDLHLRSHLNRPSDDHMTITEAAKALGRPRRTVVFWVKKKELRSEEFLRGNVRTWITRKALRAFVRDRLGTDVGAVVSWAKTGSVG